MLSANIVQNSTAVAAEQQTEIKIELPSQVKTWIDQFEASEQDSRTYLAGGYIRDTLMKQGRKSHDFDIVTGTSLDNIETVIKQSQDKMGQASYKREHDLIQIFLNDENNTIMANKSYSLSEALQKDAESRDFTVNALYADKNGCVHDPLNRGLADLKKNYLETIKPSKESFQEDPIRMLRAIYLTISLGCAGISKEVKAGISDNLQALKNLCKENPGKVNSWMFKMLCKGETSKNIDCLFSTGILNALFPNLPSAENQRILVKQSLRNLLSLNKYISLNDIYIFFVNSIFNFTAKNYGSDWFTCSWAMRKILMDNPLFKANFDNAEKINSWILNKLRHSPDATGRDWLAGNKILVILFPEMDAAIQINIGLLPWMENEIARVKANKFFDLGEIYKIFMDYIKYVDATKTDEMIEQNNAYFKANANRKKVNTPVNDKKFKDASAVPPVVVNVYNHANGTVNININIINTSVQVANLPMFFSKNKQKKIAKGTVIYQKASPAFQKSTGL
jgi:hypothetical protein